MLSPPGGGAGDSMLPFWEDGCGAGGRYGCIKAPALRVVDQYLAA